MHMKNKLIGSVHIQLIFILLLQQFIAADKIHKQPIFKIELESACRFQVFGEDNNHFTYGDTGQFQ